MWRNRGRTGFGKRLLRVLLQSMKRMNRSTRLGQGGGNRKAWKSQSKHISRKNSEKLKWLSVRDEGQGSTEPSNVLCYAKMCADSERSLIMYLI